jgi:hypothetical protein
MKRLALAAVVVSLALPAVTLGASRPNFAKAYRGTLAGSFSNKDGGETIKAQWKITGVVLRRYKVQPFEGGFTGIYKVTHGTVSYSETESGDCSYSATDKFGLAKAIGRHPTSTPFALDQDPLGRKTILGLIMVNRKLKTTESCADPNGGPATTETRTLALPTLVDFGEKGWRPGRRLHSKNTQSDRSARTVWSWNLKPGH